MEIIRADEEAGAVPVEEAVGRTQVALAAGAVVRLEVVEHLVLPRSPRRFALRPVAAAGGNSVEEAVGRTPVEVADMLRRSVAPQPSVIRTFPRELRVALRAPPDILPRASVRRRVSTRARRPVCDGRVAGRLEGSNSVAGPGSAADRLAQLPILGRPPER
jgi:hypothetical protein